MTTKKKATSKEANKQFNLARELRTIRIPYHHIELYVYRLYSSHRHLQQWNSFQPCRHYRHIANYYLFSQFLSMTTITNNTLFTTVNNIIRVFTASSNSFLITTTTIAMKCTGRQTTESPEKLSRVLSTTLIFLITAISCNFKLWSSPGIPLSSLLMSMLMLGIYVGRWVQR